MKGRLAKVVLLTRDLDAALDAWRASSGLSPSSVRESRERGGRIASLPVGDVCIDVLSPTSGDDEAARAIDAKGEGMLSIVIEVEDLATTAAELRGNGVSLGETGVDEYGVRGVMIDPASAHGVPIRLVEKRR